MMKGRRHVDEKTVLYAKSGRLQFRLWSTWRGGLRRRLPGVTPNWRRKAEMKWLTW